MILEISDMINLIEQHFQASWGSRKVLTVGGIIGTSLFKHAIHACMRTYEFNSILVVDGCQDYIGLLRNPVYNYIFYADLFYSVEIPTIDQIQRPLYRSILEPRPCYQMILNPTKLQGYFALIINNAHLIPKSYVDAICNEFGGKVLLIVDPLDLFGEQYFGQIPTLYDSLTKQSTIHAFARSIYGIDSRAIDRKVKCDFKSVKIQRRSIGKIDGNQYVTNSESILQTIRNKQLQSPFRRNQKMITAHSHVIFSMDQDGKPCAIGPQTMFSISTVSRPLMKLRIHSSASNIYASISYLNEKRGIHVKPANIISLDEAAHHRFQSAVLILGEEPMNTRMWYSLLRNVNTLMVARY